MYHHYELVTRWDMDTYFADPTPHCNTRTNEHHNARIRCCLPTHTDFRTITEEKLQKIITEINNQPRQHQQKPTNTTHNHTTTVMHLRLEQGLTITVSVSMLSLSVAGITGGVHPENTSVTCEPNLLTRNKSWQMQKC